MNRWFVGEKLGAIFRDMNTISVRQYLLGQDALNDLRLLTAPNLQSSTTMRYANLSRGAEMPAMNKEKMWLKTMELDEDYDLGLTVVRFCGIGDVEEHIKSSFIVGRTVLNMKTKTLVRLAHLENHIGRREAHSIHGF